MIVLQRRVAEAGGEEFHHAHASHDPVGEVAEHDVREVRPRSLRSRVRHLRRTHDRRAVQLQRRRLGRRGALPKEQERALLIVRRHRIGPAVHQHRVEVFANHPRRRRDDRVRQLSFHEGDVFHLERVAVGARRGGGMRRDVGIGDEPFDLRAARAFEHGQVGLQRGDAGHVESDEPFRGRAGEAEQLVVDLHEDAELLRLQIEVAGRRRALGDRRRLADPIRRRAAAQFRELDAAVRRQGDFLGAGIGERFHVPLQVDQLAEHRQLHERAAGRVGDGAERLGAQPDAVSDPRRLIGIEPALLCRHFLADLGPQPLPARIERRQVCGRQRHQEGVVPEVRDKAIRLVQLAELLVDVNLLFGQLRADAAHRVGGGLEHAVAGGILAYRPTGGPRHAPLDAELAAAHRLFESGGRLLFDVLIQLFARLEALRRRRRGSDSRGHGASPQQQ